MTSQSKDRKTVFIHVIDVCLQLTSPRGLQELKGWGLNEIDLKIYFHTYNVKKKKRKVKNKESVLPEWSRLLKCLTDYTSKMLTDSGQNWQEKGAKLKKGSEVFL